MCVILSVVLPCVGNSSCDESPVKAVYKIFEGLVILELILNFISADGPDRSVLEQIFLMFMTHPCNVYGLVLRFVH